MFILIHVLACGLLLATLAPASGSDAPAIDAVAKQAFAPFPGKAAVAFTELNDNGATPLFELHGNERFAIGSSFKLFILGVQAEEVNADRRQLADVMTLQPQWIGPPHSELAEWPIGSPVTLHTLALKMVSISDNTATDHLLHLLGRKRVEAQMAVMGHSHPEWNRPLLATREMVMLRDKNTGRLGLAYQKLDEPARRKFLVEKLSGTPNYEKLDFDAAAYDLAEWYATPMDMTRALAWLKQNTRRDRAAHPLRAILSVEPKLPHDARIWPYVGFKGGTEDQLLCGNWLLQHANGRWYSFHVFLNSPQEPLDRGKALKAIEQVFEAVQRAVE
ncbi:MAG TPA: serine hydrolase [Pirellulales bacterium]|nr:serine hydrolase [Pirellulales bacterium]